MKTHFSSLCTKCSAVVCVLFFGLYTNISAQVACNSRLFTEINFTNTGAAAARWDINSTNALTNGFMFDTTPAGFAYVPTGNFSNTKLKGQAGTNNNTRQYAIVTNPNTLNPQYANIPTANGMLVINPLQGNSDNYFSFSTSGLVPGNTYKVEIKIYNVISQSCSGGNCCAPGNCWSNFGDVFRVGNTGNATIFNVNNPGDKGAAQNLNWTGSTGGNQSGTWNVHGNPIYDMLTPTASGASVTLTTDVTVPTGNSGFTINFVKGGSDDPIVLGIEYIKIYGCQQEEIVTSTGAADGGKVCESSPITLIAQGLGPAGSTYTWTEKIGSAPATTLSNTGRTINITTAGGKGTVATYTATGMWASKSITLISQLCCYDVGDVVEVLRYDFPLKAETCNSNRGKLDGNDSVRIDPKYLFWCTGSIPDENDNQLATACNGGKCAGAYAVIKSTGNDGHWPGWTGHSLTEHTAGYTSKTGTGMLAVNASASPGIFFEYDLPTSAVCDDGSAYQFSAWYASADPAGGDACHFDFELVDKVTNTVVESTTTGKYGWGGAGGDWNDVQAGKKERWQQTTLIFTTEPGKTYMLRLVNKATGVGGNDVLIDDILITKCLPKIDFYSDDFGIAVTEAEVCYTPVEFNVSIPQSAATPNNSFSDLFPTNPTLYFQLQECDDYNPATQTGSWTSTGSYKTVTYPYTIPTFSIAPVTTKTSYRIKITANPATVITPTPPSATCGVLEFYTRKFDLTKLGNGDMSFSVPSTQKLCVGDNLSLTATAVSGTDAVKWGWAKDDPASVTLGSTTADKTYTKNSVTTTDAGTYYFVVSDATESCRANKPVTVEVNAANTIKLVSATATASQDTCLGKPIKTITYATTGATGATITGLPAGVTGTWTNDTVTISGAPSTASGSPFTYTVTLTGGSSCSAPVTTQGTITVNALPVAAISSSDNKTEISCAVKKIMLTASGAGVGGSYSWNTNPAATTNIIEIDSAYTYTVTVKDINGCTATKTLQITKDTNVPEISINGTISICKGESTTLTASDANSIAATYEWTTTGGFNQTGASITINPTATTTYKVVGTGTGANAVCTGEKEVTVTVKQPTNNTIYAEICNGQTYTVMVNGIPHNYTTDQTYTDVAIIPNAAGCDSTIVLHLTVKPVTVNDVYDQVCQNKPYTGNGFSLPAQNQSGLVIRTRAVAAGQCDSIRLNLTVIPTIQTYLTDTICQHEKTSAIGFGYLPAQEKSGTFTYKQSLPSNNTGCDSTVTLTLTVRPTYEITFTERIPMGEPYRKNGFNITNTDTPGKYTYKKELYTVSNCDSIVWLNLTVYTDIIPPTMFSPDGDGINDVWDIKYIETAEYEYILIFDQFGKKIKEYGINGFEPWDGTYLGKPAPSADYWYQIKLPEGVKNGHFSLRRRSK